MKKKGIAFAVMPCLLLLAFFLPLNTITAHADDVWGLIHENDASESKIPLILVHGDNSYKQDEERWGNFLDWVSDHQEFDDRYEIYRFRHDTSQVIGFNGSSGNAKELGDAITAQFGADRPILLLAHSRGGLVSRAYMTRYGDGNEGDRVLGLVTLATPHHGSPAAVPEWGLNMLRQRFDDPEELVDLLYGAGEEYVVNTADMGTMGLAWDNFDGPEYGIPYDSFTLESEIGNDHILSVMDANVKPPTLENGQSDGTIYLPDRSFGTLEELNEDTRYFGRMIVYGAYDTEIGEGSQNPLDWADLSIADHAGLELFTHLLASMRAKVPDGAETALLYVANDGMVPLQSALLLKSDPSNEPVFEVNASEKIFSLDAYKVYLKTLNDRMNVRKAVLCPDYDHLYMVEGKGGFTEDRSDFWDHVSSSLNQLAELTEQERQTFTPEIETFNASSADIEDIASGDNCFIGNSRAATSLFTVLWGMFAAALLAAAAGVLKQKK